MRRTDREVNDIGEKIRIIESCLICRIGMSLDEKPYVVPMNFGYDLKDEELVLYFHTAYQGKKIFMLKENPNVCFEMDCGHKLISGATACAFTMEFQSVLGEGHVVFIDDQDEKIYALHKIMKKTTGEDHFSFSETILNKTCVFKIIVSQYTGKKLKKSSEDS